MYNNMPSGLLNRFIEKMKKEALPEASINTFINYYNQLFSGKTGLIPEEDIDPIRSGEIDSIDQLGRYSKSGIDPLRQTVVIKLNGGLGTTMGLQGPKSLIKVKNGLTFLDITALQILDLNNLNGFKIPLILMNSFKTDEDSSKTLEKYPDLKTGLPFSFIQNKFPKILVSTMEPADYPSNRLLEWNPPGHGDLYTSFTTSGVLDQLIERGYHYAFVSNIDNLGATLDTEILGYFVKNQFSFLMEVTERTLMDRKGGHLARLKDDRLILREAAQCPEKDLKEFGNINRHHFFNTNNLWINLDSLKNLIKDKNSFLDLPMIRNVKKLDPLDNNTPDVYQLESAMGSAISVFNYSSALLVPRSRFSPVKSCDELLLLWSDYFLLSEDYRVVCNPSRKSSKVAITLDPLFYSRIDQLEERFPDGAPSFLMCNSLKIHGDVKFGKNITIKGNVCIYNSSSSQKFIPDNSVLNQDVNF